MEMYPFRIGMAIMTLALLLSTASGISGIPNAFYGDIVIGDSKAPDGTKVTAEISGVEYAKTTASNGQYNFNVPSDDPATSQKEGGVDGDTVVFYVNGVRAGEHSFMTGGITELKLSIPQGATPEPRVVKTPEAGGAASPGSPPPAPPRVTPTSQVTPITTHATAGETPISPGAANETQAKGEQGMGTTYILLIIAAALIILIVYLIKIKK